MDLTLVRKIAREQWATLAACAFMVGLFAFLVTYLYRSFGDTINVLGRVPLPFLMAVFGGGLMEFRPLDMWLMGEYVHPLVLTLFSVFVIATASRSLAGEIENGTVDLLLAWPVARWRLVTACGLVLLAGIGLLTLALCSGMRLGLAVAGLQGAPLVPLRWVALNLASVYVAAAAVSVLISACVSLRGRAIALSVAFLVLSLFIDLIANLWRAVGWMDYLSLFRYHRPQPLVESGQAPWSDLAVLWGIAVISFAAAIMVFQRRDIATV